MVCLECGARRKSLGHHVRGHALTLDAYRAKWGYHRDQPLIVPGISPVDRPKPRARVSREELISLRARFREAVRDGGAVCLECGRILRSLPQHLGKHHLTVEDYREKWGYNRGNPLMVPDLVEWKRQWAIAKNLAAFGPPGILQKAHEVLRVRRPPVRREARLNRSDSAKSLPGGGWRRHNLKVPAETLRALVQAGLTLRQIAARAGLRPANVWRRLRALGLVAARPVRSPIHAKDAGLLALRRAGLWNSEIAERTGMKVATVSARLERLRKRGVAVPTPVRPVPNARRRASDEELVALVGRGLQIAEVATRVGIAESTVSQRLRSLRRRGLLPQPAPGVPRALP